MEETAKVKALNPMKRGMAEVVLDKCDSFTLTKRKIKRLGLTQGAEVRLVKDMPDVYVFYGETFLALVEYI